MLPQLQTLCRFMMVPVKDTAHGCIASMNHISSERLDKILGSFQPDALLRGAFREVGRAADTPGGLSILNAAKNALAFRRVVVEDSNLQNLHNQLAQRLGRCPSGYNYVWKDKDVKSVARIFGLSFEKGMSTEDIVEKLLTQLEGRNIDDTSANAPRRNLRASVPRNDQRRSAGEVDDELITSILDRSLNQIQVDLHLYQQVRPVEDMEGHDQTLDVLEVVVGVDHIVDQH